MLHLTNMEQNQIWLTVLVYITNSKSQDSSVSTETRLWVGRLGFDSQQMQEFFFS